MGASALNPPLPMLDTQTFVQPQGSREPRLTKSQWFPIQKEAHYQQKLSLEKNVFIVFPPEFTCQAKIWKKK